MLKNNVQIMTNNALSKGIMKKNVKKYTHTHTHTHTQLNHLASHQKQTQHCKSTILELKKNLMQKCKTNAQGKANQPTISAEKKQKAIVV